MYIYVGIARRPPHSTTANPTESTLHEAPIDCLNPTHWPHLRPIMKHCSPLYHIGRHYRPIFAVWNRMHIL